MSIRWYGAGPLVLMLLVSFSARGQGIEPGIQSHVVVTDEPVRVIEVTGGANGTIYVGGSFGRLGSHTGAFFVADATSGAIEPPTALFQGDVHAILPDASGGWYVGGDGLAIDGQNEGGLVHILSDGSADPGAPFVAGRVYALAMRDTTLYFGGDFGDVGGQSRENVGALETSNQTLTSWAPQVDGLVFALDSLGTTIYVGGFLATVNGASRNNVAALDDSGGLLPWDPSAGGTVRTLLAVDQSVYIGGWFSSVGGQPRSRIAEIDATSGLVSGWDPGADNGVEALAATNDTIYAGGWFSSVAGAARSRAAAIDRTTANVLAWDPNVTTAGGSGSLVVLAVRAVGNEIVLGGEFQTVGGVPRGYVAIVDDVSGTASALTLDVSGEPAAVRAVSGDGQSHAIGGTITLAGAVSRDRVARIDPVSGGVLEWNPPIAATVGSDDFAVFDILAGETVTYITGHYLDEFNNVQPLLLAVDSITGALVPGFNPPGDPAASVAQCLALAGGSLYVGYSDGEGLGTPGLGIVDAATGAWGGFIVDTNNTVKTLALDDDASTLFFGGEFADPRSSVGALDVSSGTLDEWAADIDGPVSDIELFAGSVYVGGEFSLVGATLRSRAAAFDESTAQLLAWDPHVDGGAPHFVSALDRVGPNILLGGRFNTVSGIIRPGVAAVDGVSAAVDDWEPSPSEVSDVASSNTIVAVGGDFSSIAGTQRPNFAVFALDLTNDCNANGIPDDFEISQGLAPDCDGNGVPDECDPDCNGTEIPDACDIAEGTSLDCNANGVPDECDTASGTSLDCNGNDVPDECEVTTIILASSGPLSPIGSGFPQSFVVPDVVPATTDVCFSFAGYGDFSSSSERVDVDINGNQLITIFQIGGADCAEPPLLAEFFLPAEEVNAALGGSDTLVMTMTPTGSVNPTECAEETYISVSIFYRSDGPNDTNDDGIPDDCQTLCFADLNTDSEVGFSDLLAILAAWGPCSVDCPLCPADIDGNGEIGFGDLLILLAEWGSCA